MRKKMIFCIQLLVIGMLFTASSSCTKDEETVKMDAVISWANPADITSDTPLSANQLNAMADVPGEFIYTPSIGTLLSVGANQNLKVDFTPTDVATYNLSSKTVTINVIQSLAIGDVYQGGIVAYILVSSDPGFVAGQTHGLIAAVGDQGSSNTWNNGVNTATGATGSAIGTGSANTTAIIASQGNIGTYAAKICKDYTDGTYQDWYLPSKDELKKLYINRVAIGGFVENVYWSSTEENTDDAWGVNFFIEDMNFGTKNYTLWVRAVRSF